MPRYYVYRYGSNAANQPMDNGPCKVATVEARDLVAALELADKRVTVYNNQSLDARLADEVDAEEAEIDAAVQVEDDAEWTYHFIEGE
jgi:hypothetical protein